MTLEARRPDTLPFIGRADELAILRESLEEARAGRPQIVVIEGDAGIGKTALIDAFVGDLSDDIVVVTAQGDEAEDRLALGVVTQLVAPTRTTRIPSSGSPHFSVAVETDPLVAGAQLLSFISFLQDGDATVLMVIDDAHLADTTSTGALVFATRRLLTDRILIVLATRPGCLPSPWSQFMSGRRGSIIALSGFTNDEVGELSEEVLGVPLSANAAARLRSDTDGHPLYVKTLLVEAADQSVGRESQYGPPPPPASLAALVVEKLEGCAMDTQALVVAAAVLGRHCFLSEAAEIADVRAIGPAIEEASTVQLLVESNSLRGRELVFPHALVHAAVYGSLSTTERAELHQRASEVTLGPRSLEHRLAATLGVDIALADDLERVARQELDAGRLEAAADRLRQAATVTEPGPVADRRLLEAVETYLVAGQAAMAFEFEARLTDLPQTPYREYVLAYIALMGGRLPEAKAGFGRAWMALDEEQSGLVPDDLASRIAVCMTTLTVTNFDVEEVPIWVRACELSSPGDRHAASFSLFCRALGMGAYGRGSEALQLLDGPDTPNTADILAARGMVELWLDELPQAHRHLSMAFARARSGESVRVTQALGFLSETEHRLGRFDEAAVHAELAVQAAHDAGRVWDLPLLHSLAVYPYAARGDFEDAEKHARAADDWAEIVPIPGFHGFAANARAAIALARGDYHALLDAARSVEAAYEHVEPGFTVFGPVLAEALLELGHPEQASDALVRYEAKTEPTKRRSALVGGARVRGLLEATNGNHRAAAKAFERGYAHAGGLELPLERARLDAAYGRALFLAGELDSARERLESAVASFHAIGAAPFADLSRARLGAFGAGGPNYQIVLSATEAMVARLVGKGCSNREIAEEMVVSVKAVEYHLTNIYRRLGISSRLKLAQIVGMPKPSPHLPRIVGSD